MDKPPFATRIDQLVQAKACQMLRDDGLRQIEKSLEFHHRFLVLGKHEKNCQTGLMGQRF